MSPCRSQLPRVRTPRGQSHVVGVVLLLGLTAVAIGGLTATVGTIMAEQTGHADAERVASGFESTLRPVESTGPHAGRIGFSRGTLTTVQREIRVLNASAVLHTVQADALVFEAGDRRVAFLGGAIVRGTGEAAWVVKPPPVTAGEGVLVVGAPRLNGSGTVSGTGGVETTVRTNVSHHRTDLGRDRFRVALETETPDAFRTLFEDRGVPTRTRDLDGDGVPSVVVRFPGERVGYLVVHDVRLEVGSA